MSKRVEVYDTTLRDGTQMEGISFSVGDKIAIARRLDKLGFAFVEGGWPGSNPKDMEFFQSVADAPLQTAKVAAFGATRRPGKQVESDPNIKALLDTRAPVVTIVAKAWPLHVTDVLRTTLEENLAMVRDSVEYLVGQGLEVLFDAEHFFDGYKDDPEYATEVLRAAAAGGAACLVLCETNGGLLPQELPPILQACKKAVKVPLGFHAHNDSGCAVANTLVAVAAGLRHVQGTVNGYGERCGNTDLCAVIPSIELKMGLSCLAEGQLQNLLDASRYVAEMANVVPQDHQPYVGSSAFAHKGGLHADAIVKNPRTYEHVSPQAVGNRRRVLVSELAGRSTVVHRVKEMGYEVAKGDPQTAEILGRVEELEKLGYAFEAADGSFELLVHRVMRGHTPFFDLLGFRTSVEKREDGRLISEATIKVRVGDELEHTAAEGDGPVNALDLALRKALRPFYPSVAEMSLVDFRVRVLDAGSGTAARVRVLIESADHEASWSTVGVSENVIEASWQALVDSVEYKLLRDRTRTTERKADG